MPEFLTSGAQKETCPSILVIRRVILAACHGKGQDSGPEVTWILCTERKRSSLMEFVLLLPTSSLMITSAFETPTCTKI